MGLLGAERTLFNDSRVSTTRLFRRCLKSAISKALHCKPSITNRIDTVAPPVKHDHAETDPT